MSPVTRIIGIKDIIINFSKRGDLYHKRWALTIGRRMYVSPAMAPSNQILGLIVIAAYILTVSYTHLTLPTIYSV